MPIFYECDRCTACCRWPGQVKLSAEELSRIAGFLGLDEATFRNQFMRLNSARTGLVLEDRPDGACIFLEGDACRIQSVKPQQCRDFPNLWNFPGFQDACRAKEWVLDSESWRQRVLQATGRKELPTCVPPEKCGKLENSD